MPAVKKYASAAARQAAYRARCKARRESQQSIPATGPVYRRWLGMRMQALSLLEQVAREMETYHTRRSEAWRESERGEMFVEMMESVVDTAGALKDIPSNPSDA